MKKFRMYYYFNGNHWTLIKQSDKPEDIITYIQDNLSELEDAFDEDAPNYFKIGIFNSDNECRQFFQGDPQELLAVMENNLSYWE